MYGKITLLEASFSLTGWERVAFKQSMPESVYWIVRGRACVPNHGARWRQVIIFILAAWIHHFMEEKLPVCSETEWLSQPFLIWQQKEKMFLLSWLETPSHQPVFYLIHGKFNTAESQPVCGTFQQNIFLLSVKTYETLSREYLEFVPCSFNSKSWLRSQVKWNCNHMM